MSIDMDTLNMLIASIEEELETASFSVNLATKSWNAALKHAKQTGDKADLEIADGLREFYEAERRIHDELMTSLSMHVMERMRAEDAAAAAHAPLGIG